MRREKNPDRRKGAPALDVQTNVEEFRLMG
jgi:hypothetical protein